jgi:hypothetical protein
MPSRSRSRFRNVLINTLAAGRLPRQRESLPRNGSVVLAVEARPKLAA